MRRIGVFCGSSSGDDPRHAAGTRALARALVRHRLALVYGGTSVGLMGILAEAVLAQGGEAFGVIPEGLVERECAHRGLTSLSIVPDMETRKREMAVLSDAFVALPGGFGTLDELFEMLTWNQLGLHSKPCGLLDIADYYQPLWAFLERAVAQGFIRPEHHHALVLDRDADRLLQALATWQPRAAAGGEPWRS